ncbi:MAG TPA: geranylgeranylglycerol-phosphate geranylgeranyltransferase [Bacteroidia bacterium]|nr:geranylgeranylglycerol-phosphate geranylgeranyltransferase [Bacteroidia bacterium]HNS13480.1 geranylgeranylglycerol-phosphate geranylgeranyltransferase [Bacteroidia bacterium]
MIFNFFRLIRLPNLCIIALSQILIRYFIILPAFETESIITGEFPAHLSLLDFILLITSTLVIAAAGYIINDVYDIETDQINKPGKNKIGSLLKIKTARRISIILSLTGIVMGFYLAWKIDRWIMGGIHVFSAFSLWMYASQFKKKLLSGNILISILTALSILIVGLFEPEFYRNFIYLALYAAFAFSITLVREIIKDMEDLEGDRQTGCDSIPIRFGLKNSKLIVYGLIIMNMSLLVYVLHYFFASNKVIDFWLLVLMFIIPFVALGTLIKMADVKKDYFYAGIFTKVIMIAGILTMIPLYYYFLR